MNPQKIMCKCMMSPRGKGASCTLAFPQADWMMGGKKNPHSQLCFSISNLSPKAELLVSCLWSTLVREKLRLIQQQVHIDSSIITDNGSFFPLKDVNSRRGNRKECNTTHIKLLESECYKTALSVNSSESIKGRSIQCRAQSSTSALKRTVLSASTCWSMILSN